MKVPYYETELGKLYHGDCLEMLPQLTEKVDLVLTDPPYGIGEARNKNRSRGCIAQARDYGTASWDDEIPCKEIFDLIFEISKNQIIFGGNYFVEYLKNSPCWLVWDKDNGKTDFADCELAWTSFQSAVRKYIWKWQGMLQQDMKDKDQRVHPTQKPIRLFYMILRDYSKDNDLILDPFVGSGTCMVACERLGRRWIGIEMSKEYCDIAIKRIEQERSQMKLPL